MNQQVGTPKAREVTRWQCRGCQKLVGITADALDLYERFNAELLRRNEPHLDNRKIVFCEACKADGLKQRADGLRKQADRMAELIRKLKASRTPEWERDAIKQLEAWGHPDVPGLVQSIRDRISGKSTGGTRGPKGTA